MKYGEILIIGIFIALNTLITVIETNEIKEEIKHSKEKQERFDALVRDSVKMHEFYEKVQLNYQEKYNLMN